MVKQTTPWKLAPKLSNHIFFSENNGSTYYYTTVWRPNYPNMPVVDTLPTSLTFMRHQIHSGFERKTWVVGFNPSRTQWIGALRTSMKLISKQMEIHRKHFIIWQLEIFLSLSLSLSLYIYIYIYIWVLIPCQDCVKIQKTLSHWERVEQSKGELFFPCSF